MSTQLIWSFHLYGQFALSLGSNALLLFLLIHSANFCLPVYADTVCCLLRVYTYGDLTVIVVNCALSL